jgi:ubiquinone/menaquinone biosynthesis C-methylase UbiE
MTVTPQYILAPYVPTPHKVVQRMLEIAGVTANDLVYDVGCGDGRVVIAAAHLYGARGMGIDVEPYWVDQSRQNAKPAGVADLVRFEVSDAMSFDFSLATVITLYLVGWSTGRIVPIIMGQVNEGTRIVSHNFTSGNWEPARVESTTDEEGGSHTLYLWIK